MPSIASDCGGFDSNGGCLRATGDGFGGGLSVAGGGGGRLDVIHLLHLTTIQHSLVILGYLREIKFPILRHHQFLFSSLIFVNYCFVFFLRSVHICKNKKLDLTIIYFSFFIYLL